MTPFETPLLIIRIASRSVSRAFGKSLEAIACRAFLIALLTAVRTPKLRTRRFCDWRLRFSADRMLAKAVP